MQRSAAADEIRSRCSLTSPSNLGLLILRSLLRGLRPRVLHTLGPHFQPRSHGATADLLDVPGINVGLLLLRVRLRALQARRDPRPVVLANAGERFSIYSLPAIELHRDVHHRPPI